MLYGAGVGVVVIVGCNAFWDEPPPPPTAAQIATMQEAQTSVLQQSAKLETEIKRIRAQNRQTQAIPDGLSRFRDWSMKETVVDSLGRIGEPAVTELIKALRDPNVEIRRQAVTALARIGPEAAAAVPELVNRLDDVDLQVRKGAIRALGQIGPAAGAAVPRLFELLGTIDEMPTTTP